MPKYRTADKGSFFLQNIWVSSPSRLPDIKFAKFYLSIFLKHFFNVDVVNTSCKWKDSQFDLVGDRSESLRMQEDIINGVLRLGESDTSLPWCTWCWMKYQSCLQIQYQTVSIIFMTFLVRWSRMRMLDDISTNSRLLGFGRLNLWLGLVWGCRMTSAPSTEYWD